MPSDRKAFIAPSVESSPPGAWHQPWLSMLLSFFFHKGYRMKSFSRKLDLIPIIHKLHGILVIRDLGD